MKISAPTRRCPSTRQAPALERLARLPRALSDRCRPGVPHGAPGGSVMHGRSRRPRLHLLADRPRSSGSASASSPTSAARSTTATSRSRLEEAQRRKHEYVAEQIGIGPGRRVLDLGCGWGPLLDFVRAAAGTGVGVTLSSRAGGGVPAPRPRRAPLRRPRAHARDASAPFDAVASLGAFEHFCSPEELRAGRQEEIYRDALRPRRERAARTAGGFYLQTMVFGRNMIPLEEVDIDAAARLRRLVPRAAGAPVPRLVAAVRATSRSSAAPSRTSASCRASSGRLDYIETIRQWRRRFGRAQPAQVAAEAARSCRAG